MPLPPSRIGSHRTKHGREILIDIAWIHEMPTFIHSEPHWLGFYDITLITRGTGWFWLDGHRYHVTPGQVLFTTPGQIRRWEVTGLDGICLFFPATFLPSSRSWAAGPPPEQAFQSSKSRTPCGKQNTSGSFLST